MFRGIYSLVEESGVDFHNNSHKQLPFAQLLAKLAGTLVQIINKGSCKDQKKALAICLQRSPCVLIDRNTPKDCLTDPVLKTQLPELCVANFKAFMDCKNGMFDMRKRMRGNAPISTGKYDETYNNLSSGNFNAHDEMKKLEVLNRNLSKRRLEEEKNKREAANLEN